MMEHLISNNRPNQILKFSGSDQEYLFFKNKKKLGEGWEYANKRIVYNYNEYGFRTQSFDKIVWQDSVVILGCSHVEGIGLAEEDTIAVQLEHILGIPVVNLGLGGSAVDIAAWNSLILHEHYPHPKAIVQLWTGLDRYSDYSEKDNRCKSNIPMHGDYYTKQNWNFRSKLYIKADRVLWNNKVPYHEASFSMDTANQMGIEHYGYVDSARDQMHGGVATAKLVAKKIAINLKL